MTFFCLFQVFLPPGAPGPASEGRRLPPDPPPAGVPLPEAEPVQVCRAEGQRGAGRVWIRGGEGAAAPRWEGQEGGGAPEGGGRGHQGRGGQRELRQVRNLSAFFFFILTNTRQMEGAKKPRIFGVRTAKTPQTRHLVRFCGIFKAVQKWPQKVPQRQRKRLRKRCCKKVAKKRRKISQSVVFAAFLRQA